MPIRAVTIDFHNTIARCDRWFALEIRELVPEVLHLLTARGAFAAPDGSAEPARDGYRTLRQGIVASGEERDALDCTLTTLHTLGLAPDEGAVAAAIETLMREALAEAQPEPGIVAAIEALHARGLRLGVVSSAVHHPSSTGRWNASASPEPSPRSSPRRHPATTRPARRSITPPCANSASRPPTRSTSATPTVSTCRARSARGCAPSGMPPRRRRWISPITKPTPRSPTSPPCRPSSPRSTATQLPGGAGGGADRARQERTSDGQAGRRHCRAVRSLQRWQQRVTTPSPGTNHAPRRSV